MKNDLKRSKLGSSVIPLYIASWNGVQKTSKDGVSKCESDLLKKAIDAQLGDDMSLNFKDNFVNYKLGYILCVNTPALLNKFYKSDEQERVKPTDPKYIPPTRFTKVLMPPEFISRRTSLSSEYKLGEKLSVRAGYEIINKKQIAVYRDTNAKGRSRMKTGGGGAVAVWS